MSEEIITTKAEENTDVNHQQIYLIFQELTIRKLMKKGVFLYLPNSERFWTLTEPAQSPTALTDAFGCTALPYGRMFTKTSEPFQI